MKLSNREIYNIYTLFEKSFQEDNNKQYLPSKINFFILKNKKLILTAMSEIDLIRKDIIKNYGILQENNEYFIENSNIDLVNNELNDLLSIEQEIDISKIKLSDIENLEFTLEQMEALMFMIEED